MAQTKSKKKTRTKKSPLSQARKAIKANAKKAGKAVKKLVRKVEKKVEKAGAKYAKQAASRIPKQAIHQPPVQLKEGDTAPDFSAATDEGKTVSLKDFRGRKVVLYFYPKDDTPGCTVEACSFRDGISEIRAKRAEVLGVSVDGVDSHRKFKTKYSLNFPLLADTEKKLVNAYGVWKEKNMYGRTYMGTARMTFLIDENGKIQKIFPKVDVKAHSNEVLQALG